MHPNAHYKATSLPRILPLFLILLSSAFLLAGCGGGESDETIAATVAKDWVDTSIDKTSDALAEFVIGEQTLLAQLAGNILANQIRENLSWSYSTPQSLGDNTYQVIATAIADVNVDIPVLGDRAYSVTVPFDLKVDIDTRTVVNWRLDVLAARVEEQGN